MSYRLGCLTSVLFLLLTHVILATVAPSIHETAESHVAFMSQERAHDINQRTGGIWAASHANGRLQHASLDEIKSMLGAKLEKHSSMDRKTFSKATFALELPQTFDAAKQWPHCGSIKRIYDQAGCGSCWAVGAVSAMNDRYCILTDNADVRVSAGSLLSCCSLCGLGCSGGYPYAAWLYWSWFGLPSEECNPYPFESCSHHHEGSTRPSCKIESTPPCPTKCENGSEITDYNYGRSAYSLDGELDFMYELYQNGPFEVGFMVYDDFLYYQSGVYSKTESATELGGHAVRLLGWGELNGVKYWKIANSWNEEWGDNGYFLIRRGTDECGIESNGYAGTPRMKHPQFKIQK